MIRLTPWNFYREHTLSPAFQPLRRRRHIFFRPTIAEPQKPVAACAVEIHTGADRHANLLQHSRAKGRTVVGAITDIGPKVECAFGGGQLLETGFGKCRQQVIAGPPIALHISLQLIMAVE